MDPRRSLLALAVLCAICSPASAYDLTYQNMLIASMKINPNFDYDNAVDGYMQAFRPTVWQQSHDDEFEKHGKEAETVKMMKGSAESFNLSDPIIINTGIQFGEYNFKVHQFALNPFTESSFFPVNYCCANGIPNQIKLFLSNADIINGLPMDEAAAKDFLNQHKQYGNVNRALNAQISVVLKSAKSDNELIGEVTKVVIHDPMNKNAVVETLNAKNGS